MAQKMTSILLSFLLLMGVASSLHFSDEEDGDILRPFVTNSQKRRICVELCLSGLGGTPCGDECADITPLDLPIQSNLDNDTNKHVTKNLTRNSACSILCKNGLGVPLCNCDDELIGDVEVRPEIADFIQICNFFCVTYNYHLNGCQKCSVYQSSFSSNILGGSSRVLKKYQTAVDWDGWCLKQCTIGNGGAACNCDRLPFKY